MKIYKIHDKDMNQEQIEAANFMLLVTKCSEARKRAEEARLEQLELERKILEFPFIKENLKTSGSNKFGNLKITTKVNQKWDQKLLSEVIKSNDFPVMPFEVEYKPNAAKLKVLKDEFPQTYNKLICALTISEAKPYFTFEGGE